MALLAISFVGLVAATDVHTGIGVDITTEAFKPLIWQCGDRVLADDQIENGANNLSLSERKNNYAFTGESIQWNVLVMDKNKIEQVTDVVGTIGPTQGEGNDVEVECVRQNGAGDNTNPSNYCNAKILEENLTVFNPNVMAYYTCTLTVEPSMHGEYFLTVEAKDSTGLSSTMDENEFWFLNPTIALSVDGDLSFNDVRPGTTAYSKTLLVGNDAEAGSGVMLDMFISGTDFYDPAADGARCSLNSNGQATNMLALTAFRYYATSGAYSTKVLNGVVGTPNPLADSEGYLGIAYGDKITQANKLILGTAYGAGADAADWTNGNALTPGAEMALVFKLNMPEPCVGDFSDGSIFFWGEAI